MYLYIPHNRRTPLQAEEALGPISIPRGSRGVGTNNRLSYKVVYVLNMKLSLSLHFVINKPSALLADIATVLAITLLSNNSVITSPR